MKIIKEYWRNEKHKLIVVYLEAGCCGGSFSIFDTLYNEALQDFPGFVSPETAEIVKFDAGIAGIILQVPIGTAIPVTYQAIRQFRPSQ